MGGGDLITVTASTSQKAAVRGLANTIDMLLELRTSKDTENPRPDYQVCLVLDRSGSMAGQKLQNAKKGIENVINNLGSTDTLHVVVYDTNAEIVIENGNIRLMKDMLIEQVNGIRSGSCTNISGGLELASQVLEKYGGANKRVFLFSDGLVNRGKQGKALYDVVQDMHEKGIITTAYGIGNDFDEEVMSTIAEYGRGDFAFLDIPENIPKFVRKGLRSMLSTLGTNGTLRVKGLNGAVVKKIYGHEDIVRGAQLGDIHEDNHRQLLAQIEISPVDTGSGNQVDEVKDVLFWEISYKPTSMPTSGFETVTGRIAMPITNDAALAIVEDDATWKVRVALGITNMGDVDEKVLDLLDQNKLDAAIELKSSALDKLEALQDKDESGFVKSVLTRGRRTLEEMKKRENISKMRKHCFHEAQMERAMSANSLCYDAYHDNESFGSN